MVRPPGGTDDGGNIPTSLADLVFPQLGDYAGTLVAIAKNPKNFVLGALLSLLIGGVLDIFRYFVEGIRIVFLGDGLGYAEGQLIGIEDLFYIGWDIISGAFQPVGSAILGVVQTFQNTAVTVGTGLGIGAFPVSVALVVLMAVAAYRILMTSSRALIASVPVLGGVLEVLIYE